MTNHLQRKKCKCCHIHDKNTKQPWVERQIQASSFCRKFPIPWSSFRTTNKQARKLIVFFTKRTKEHRDCLPKTEKAYFLSFDPSRSSLVCQPQTNRGRDWHIKMNEWFFNKAKVWKMKPRQPKLHCKDDKLVSKN